MKPSVKHCWSNDRRCPPNRQRFRTTDDESVVHLSDAAIVIRPRRHSRGWKFEEMASQTRGK